MSINITIPGGEKRRLLTGGKYCPEDILVEAEAGGVELPEMENPAAESEIFLGRETIGEDGSIKTGTFTIDAELTEQDSLIAQIKAALVGKAAGGSGVSTCGVRYDIPVDGSVYAVFYSAMENGQICTKIWTYHDAIEITDGDGEVAGYYGELDNVVVGSTMQCWFSDYISNFSIETSGAVRGEVNDNLLEDGYEVLSFQILSDATITVKYAE